MADFEVLSQHRFLFQGLVKSGRHGFAMVSDLKAEVSRLKRELAIACEERCSRKKATAYPLVRAVAALLNVK